MGSRPVSPTHRGSVLLVALSRLPYRSWPHVIVRDVLSPALSYGFDPVGAVVWLDVPSDSTATGLCLQHAERLTAPKGWTIDDRRDLR